MEITIKLETGEIEQLSKTAETIVSAFFTSRSADTAQLLASLDKFVEKLSEIGTGIIAVNTADAEARAADAEARAAEARAAEAIHEHLVIPVPVSVGTAAAAAAAAKSKAKSA